MLRTQVLKAHAAGARTGGPLTFVVFACVFCSWSALFQILFVQTWPETKPLLVTDVGLTLGLLAAYAVWTALTHLRVLQPHTGAGFTIVSLGLWLRSIATLRHTGFYLRDASMSYVAEVESMTPIALTTGTIAYCIGFGLVVSSCMFDLSVRRRAPWWIEAA